MVTNLPDINTQQIIAQRSSKNTVNANKPYDCMIEVECGSDLVLHRIATLFLTGSECPFHCVMCDLWKNTLDYATPIGSIPFQILWALENLQIDWQNPLAKGVSTIKLYNSSNFFDKRAVPIKDWPEIAKLVSAFETIIVENHPGLCSERILKFRDLIAGRLEVAMGLETTHPKLLKWLNKQMTLKQYQNSVDYLITNNIQVRSFILVKLPSLTEEEGIEWAVKSMEFAFDCGVECCSLVPVRKGNGFMDQLEKDGFFKAPNITSLECVLESGLSMGRGRVFVDLWDSQAFEGCSSCKSLRLQRIMEMNEYQSFQPEVQCHECC